MTPGVLFAIATAIWGSTWLAIKFQLGVVDPAVSVAYRFALASLMLALWCAATGRSLGFPPRAHGWFAAQGATFFGLNYIGVYGFIAYLAHTWIRPAAIRRTIVGLLVSLISLVGPSRVYLGHHWFTDVTASYMLGTTYLIAIANIYRFVRIRVSRRQGQVR